MKLIIASNYKEYLNYLIEENEAPQNAEYIRTSDQLRGFSSGEIIRYGSYYRNKQIDWQLVEHYEARFKEKKL